MSQIPFDRRAVRRNRNRAAKRPGDYAFLADLCLSHLIERLQDVRRKFPLGLLIGAKGGPAQEPALKKTGGVQTLICMDMAENILIRHGGGEWRITADEEFLPFAPQSLDLTLANFTLHAVNDLPGALLHIRRALKPDGLFLAALPGGNTLHELRASLMRAEIDLRGGASPRVFPFADKQQAAALMQRAGFALPVVDSETVTVTYDNIFKLMADLRGMGEGNSLTGRERRFLPRSLLMRAAEIYQKDFSDPDGRIRATFEIMFLSGWSSHNS